MELTDELPPPVPLIPVPRVSPGAADDDDDNDKLLLLLFPDPTAREDIELVGKPECNGAKVTVSENSHFRFMTETLYKDSFIKFSDQ